MPNGNSAHKRPARKSPSRTSRRASVEGRASESPGIGRWWKEMKGCIRPTGEVHPKRPQGSSLTQTSPSDSRIGMVRSQSLSGQRRVSGSMAPKAVALPCRQCILSGRKDREGRVRSCSSKGTGLTNLLVLSGTLTLTNGRSVAFRANDCRFDSCSQYQKRKSQVRS